MYRLFICGVFVVGLLGCEAAYWTKPGSTRAQFNSDRAKCLQQSYQAAPVVNQTIAVGSGYVSPGTATCTGFGSMVSCTTYPGSYTPPPSITLDANLQVRNRYFEECMQGLGYYKSALGGSGGKEVVSDDEFWEKLYGGKSRPKVETWLEKYRREEGLDK